MHSYTAFFIHCLFLAGLLLLPSQSLSQPTSDGLTPLLIKEWISHFKTSERGPFSGIRWYCNDGSVQPARAGCSRRGGGIQHGEWNDQINKIKDAGYPIGFIFADLKFDAIQNIRFNPQQLLPLVLERYLVAADDGWIYRRARYYRGAVQNEDEAEAAENLLLTLLADKEWVDQRYLRIREAVRLFPNVHSLELLSEIRALSSRIAVSDRRFVNLKNKIHTYPDGADAARVREYAAGRQVQVAARSNLMRLAELIDRAYDADKLLPSILSLRSEIESSLISEALNNLQRQLSTSRSTADRYKAFAEAMVVFREQFKPALPPRILLKLIEGSILLEQGLFALRQGVIDEMRGATRRRQLEFAGTISEAVYGAGLISLREYLAVKAALAKIISLTTIPAEQYRSQVAYLARVPGWASSRLEVTFGPGIEKLIPIEPLAAGYIPDRMRSSALLLLSEHIDKLQRDAALIIGAPDSFFGQPVYIGLKALNPGMAKGTLSRISSHEEISPTQAPAHIGLVPNYIASLPPLAGVLTENEGNALSHVQILAANLGIPNVVVSPNLLPRIAPYINQEIVMAVSPKGRIEIDRYSPRWTPLFDIERAKPAVLIKPEVDRLDLKFRQFVSLRDLRAGDSGRIVGPKAAKLGELKAMFPGTVTEGIAIPFGVFATILQQELRPGLTLFDWMKEEYRQLNSLPINSRAYSERSKKLLDLVRMTILRTPLAFEFRNALFNALKAELGPPGSYGVFVRSDTNIEDLADFTGAGLNKTVPNVVDFDGIVSAILEVWASPFTERAFSWRQAHMTSPEHVYVSVLLLRTVAVDKSGVMVTADMESNDPDYLTIAVNEGLTGAVENQAVESIIVNRENGEVRLVSEARAQTKKIADSRGGLREVPATPSERILSTQEISRLAKLADEVEERFPREKRKDSRPSPFDVEFGFKDGKLVLFQIRPYKLSERAKRNEYLKRMDQIEPAVQEKESVPPPPKIVNLSHSMPAVVHTGQ
ncbi:MAG: phosphoenolpyruvate synthase [Deltaproteobacteria bacterium]|nr:phosphoenolpyruvate synthase [Deltaproteobacteria bacterium]